MSEQMVEAVPPSPAKADPAQAVKDAVASMHEQYGSRAAHGGRLEQMDAAATHLVHLMEQLPDEEVREADYEERLLASYRSGDFGISAGPGHEHTASHDARERLQDALRRGKAG
jgi:hypothetical protein